MFGKKKKLKEEPGAAATASSDSGETGRSAAGNARRSIFGRKKADSTVSTNAGNNGRAAQSSDSVREPAFSFEASRMSMLEKSERRAWAVAKGMGLVTICLSGAIWIMSPLKQGVPYVYEVDRNTGQTTLLRVANPQSIPRTELMDKYWVTEYIRSRETYDYNTVDAEFRRVREMTMADQFGPYMKQFQGENSLDRVLGPAKMIRIEILSVGIEGDGIARVRFIRRQINTANMAPENESYWTATIGFQYLPNYTNEGDRLLVNPFGFKVTSYRLDQEFTRGGLAVEPSRPTARKLTPKEQYDLPDLPDEGAAESGMRRTGDRDTPANRAGAQAEVSGETFAAPVNAAAESGTNAPAASAQTVPLDVQTSAPTPSATGQSTDGTSANVSSTGTLRVDPADVRPDVRPSAAPGDAAASAGSAGYAGSAKTAAAPAAVNAARAAVHAAVR